MFTQDQLRIAASKALKIRARAGIELDQSFCVVDLASSLDLEVKYVDMKSMEGALLKDSKVILLSAHRPDGRTRFTCAHEIAHYVFNHGDHFDELVENINKRTSRTEEALADTFAHYLLMPETTVRSGFIQRGYSDTKPNPIEIYEIANWLGVGYTTLLNQMAYNFRMLDGSKLQRLKKISPASIKSEIAGQKITTELIVYNSQWKKRPLDLSVGDYIYSVGNTIQDCSILTSTNNRSLFQAVAPGTHAINTQSDGNQVIIRIKRAKYTGRAKYRYLSEV